ncbi:hypothetical protein DDZ14_17020 [Maritimibacter sp. 55A14]|uniref:VOC family protein n=1 Tax=Maritimibacter sp. 55A14 TaxID=2174844 RepID=UPI000D611AB9|nr:VOC family protein [Maritimibacter sp. 55A14]PWE29448.1 hypothetical protein DDZ14_17020 [Maritimibacter sp. 55A14]
MRWRGISHLELSVPDYDNAVTFYDRMFGWLGYKSFWTLDIGYRSTYYMARFPWPHSYVGIQPARTGGKLDHGARATGIHHVALWAKSRREVDAFHREFLRPEGVTVTDPPAEYAVYAPGYYAVFFDDPVSGIHWELAHIPRLPTPRQFLAFRRALRNEAARHPDWSAPPEKLAMRKLPPRSR